MQPFAGYEFVSTGSAAVCSSAEFLRLMYLVVVSVCNNLNIFLLLENVHYIVISFNDFEKIVFESQTVINYFLTIFWGRAGSAL